MVAKRALVLRHLVAIPISILPEDVWPAVEVEAVKASAAKNVDEIWTHLLEAGLESAISGEERTFFLEHATTMTTQQHTVAYRRIESFQALLWALGLVEELPAYDQPAADSVLELTRYPYTSFLEGAKLLDKDLIEEARSIAEMWHWRSRTHWLLTTGGLGFLRGKLAKTSVRKLAQLAFKDGEIPPPINDDFPVNGKAYRDLSDEEWSEIRSITFERHHALNWLCGYAPDNDWDQTPTDT